MAKDVTIAGQDYADVPSVQIPLVGGGVASFIDTSDATATADKVVSGYTAYGSDGTKITGTADNAFIITLAYNDHVSKWVPDKEFYEISEAYTAGKEIVVECTGSSAYVSEYVSADGDWRGQYFSYWVRQYQNGRLVEQGYNFNSDGLFLNETCVYDDTSSATLSSGDQLLSGVTAVANGVTYTGTISTKSASDLTSFLSTVTVPAGYYAESVSKSVSAVTHPKPTLSINSSTGAVTASHSQDTGYQYGGTTTETLNLATQGSSTITPTKSSQLAVARGVYTTGSVIVSAIPSQYVDTTDATATASEILAGYTAYGSNGTKITGTAAMGGVFQDESGFLVLDPSGHNAAQAHLDGLATGTWPAGNISFQNATSVRPYAFYANDAIRAVSASKVTSIGSNAFRMCSNLSTVSFPAATSIDTYAFANCSTLTVANFPSVTSLGSSAFLQCSALNTASFQNLTSIGSSAFCNCTSLTTLSFPNAISIGTGAFYSCKKLTTASFSNVTSIYASAFQNCTSLTTVSIPNATYIAAYTFSMCLSLTMASFPNATYVGSSAFDSCHALVSAYFPEASSIYTYAFYANSALTTVSFPKLSYIGTNVFLGCRVLSSVSFPNVLSIGSSAFVGCSALQTISFPSAKYVYPHAFKSCYSLSEANFPSVLGVYSYAFYSCTNMKTISFPNVTGIYSYAFYGCSLLESAYFLGSTVPTLSTMVFNLTPFSDSTYIGQFGSIYVKASLLESFRAATNWSAYADRMVGLTDAQIEALE